MLESEVFLAYLVDNSKSFDNGYHAPITYLLTLATVSNIIVLVSIDIKLQVCLKYLYFLSLLFIVYLDQILFEDCTIVHSERNFITEVLLEFVCTSESQFPAEYSPVLEIGKFNREFSLDYLASI